jgi:hypothetical protein
MIQRRGNHSSFMVSNSIEALTSQMIPAEQVSGRETQQAAFRSVAQGTKRLARVPRENAWRMQAKRGGKRV